jgi:excisionase family DNA binding protein
MSVGSRVTAPTPEPRPWRDEAEGHALLTVREAAAFLRIGRNTCYELIRQRRIPHVRLGRRVVIPRYGLEQWIAREAGLPEPPSPVVSFALQRH